MAAVLVPVEETAGRVRRPVAAFLPSEMDDEDVLEHSEVHVFVAIVAVVLLYFAVIGLWCIAVCGGWGGVKSCKTEWFGLKVKATCKR